jgi:hypothetical protein
MRSNGRTVRGPRGVLASFHPFRNEECRRRKGGRSTHASRLARRAAFSKEITSPENRYDSLIAALVYDREPHNPFWMYMTISAGSP